MANIFQKINIGNIRMTLQEVSVRFPLALVLSLVVTGILWYLTMFERSVDTHTQALLIKVVITCVVSFFLSVSMSLLSESEKCPGFRRYLSQVVVVLFGAFFYSTLDGYASQSIESIVFIFLTLSGFLSLLFVAPFMRRILSRKYDQDVYYAYFYRTSLVFLFSMIAGGAMMLL